MKRYRTELEKIDIRADIKEQSRSAGVISLDQTVFSKDLALVIAQDFSILADSVFFYFTTYPMARSLPRSLCCAVLRLGHLSGKKR